MTVLETPYQRALRRRKLSAQPSATAVQPPQQTQDSPVSPYARAQAKRQPPQQQPQLAIDAASTNAPPSIDLKTRALAQLTANPDARLRFLQERFGVGNVTVDPQTDQIRIQQGAQERVLDPPGLDLGDIVDVPGEVAETLAGIGGSLGLGLPGAALATGATRAATEKLFEGLTGVESGALGQGAASGVVTGLVDGVFKGAGAAAKAIGRHFSTSRPLLMNKLTKQWEAFQNIVQNAFRDSTDVIGSSAEAGRQVASGLDGGIKTMRRALAEGPGKAIERAVALAPKNDSIPVDRVRDLLQRLASAESKAVGGDKALADALESSANQLVSRSSNRRVPGTVSLREFQDLFSRAGRASSGKGSLLQIPETPEGRRVAGEVAAEIQETLADVLAQRPQSLTSQAVRQLRDARKDYKLASDEIRNIENGWVKTIFGLDRRASFEGIGDSFFRKSITPSEVRTVAQTLRKTNPKALAELQGLVTQSARDAIAQAEKLPADAAASLLRKQARKFNALFESDPTAANALKDLQAIATTLTRRNVRLKNMPETFRLLAAADDVVQNALQFVYQDAAQRPTAQAIANLLRTSRGIAALKSAMKFAATGGGVMPPAVRDALITNSLGAGVRQAAR